VIPKVGFGKLLGFYRIYDYNTWGGFRYLFCAVFYFVYWLLFFTIDAVQRIFFVGMFIIFVLLLISKLQQFSKSHYKMKDLR
jgi:hypothetical protein